MINNLISKAFPCFSSTFITQVRFATKAKMICVTLHEPIGHTNTTYDTTVFVFCAFGTDAAGAWAKRNRPKVTPTAETARKQDSF